MYRRCSTTSRSLTKRSNGSAAPRHGGTATSSFSVVRSRCSSGSRSTWLEGGEDGGSHTPSLFADRTNRRPPRVALGTTFAAGVYASIFGSSREPVNALYARRMFDTIKECRQRHD